MENSSYEKIRERFPDISKSTSYELELIASEIIQRVIEETDVFEFKEMLENLKHDMGINKYWEVIRRAVSNQRPFKVDNDNIKSIMGILFNEDYTLNHTANYHQK